MKIKELEFFNKVNPTGIIGGNRFAAFSPQNQSTDEEITFDDEITIVCNGDNCGVEDDWTGTSYPLP